MKQGLFLILFAFWGAGADAAEYLVKYRNTAGLQSVNALSGAENSKIQIRDHHKVGSLVKVFIDKKSEVQVLAKLLSQEGVEYVVPNMKLHAFAAPVTTTALRDQWALTKVQAENAWKKAGHRGNRNVVVAVIDTGVDYKHANLLQNMISGFDFIKNTNDPMDKTGFQNPGHGTHCAGVIGSTGLIDDGIVGLSPEVSLMPLRFLDENGSGDLNNGIKAIDYAIEKGAHIISASWGAVVPRDQAAPLLEAVKRADDKGIIFIAAAANDGKNNDKTDVFPANSGYPQTISVAASGSKDEKPSWSNYGKARVHLAAPGEGIISTLPNNKYGSLSGTSMATPLVAGLAALLKAQDPTLTGAQIRAILQVTGAKVAIETACNCRIDASAAVTHVVDKKPLLVPSAASIKKNDTLAFTTLNTKPPLKFSSSDVNVATIADDGVLTGLADGKTMVTVTDADGVKTTSLEIWVGPASGGNDPGQPGQPGQPGECPLGDPALCDMICQVQPTLPFCDQ